MPKKKSNNTLILEKYRRRQLKMKNQTPNHGITKHTQADREVNAERRRLKGKLPAPKSKRLFRDEIIEKNNPLKRASNPTARTLTKKNDAEDELEERRVAIEKVKAANILLNLRKEFIPLCRAKKRGGKRKTKKRRRKSRKRRKTRKRRKR